MTSAGGLATAATARARKKALDRQDEIAGLCHRRFGHVNVGNIQRNGDEYVLRHGKKTLYTQPNAVVMLPQKPPVDNHYI